MRPMSTDKALGLCRVFRHCLHLGNDTSVVEKSLRELQSLDAMDVKEYLDSDSRLAPLVFWHLKRRGLTYLLEPTFAADLAYKYLENIARNTLFERRLQEILKDFSREQVEVIVLKGASVFVRRLSVFRDAFVLSDIDLMVRPADLDRAAEILNSKGYSLISSEAMDGGIKRTFLGTDHATPIDLHAALFWVDVRFKYLDSFPSDVWQASIAESIGEYPVRILSLEDQICFRLAHDAIAHRTLLLSSTCRLYYLCLLIDFYRDSIDWAQLLQKLKRKGSDRLVAAYAHYGKRELGLRLPRELEEFHRGADDVAYLDAVTDASHRIADYSYRASVAALTSPNLPKRLKQVYKSAVRDCLVQRRDKEGTAASLADISLKFKVACLQSAAVLYVSVHGLRHNVTEGKGHDG